MPLLLELERPRLDPRHLQEVLHETVQPLGLLARRLRQLLAHRALLRPSLDYIDDIQSRGDDQMVTIVLPEFLPRRLWQNVLHNQTALLVKAALLFRKNIVVADVPYLLRR